MAKDTKKHGKMSAKDSWKPDKTVIKSLGLMGFGKSGQISAVDLKDGKILRIRPLHMDSKYSEEQVGLWEMKVKGKTFKPYMKTIPHYFNYGYKKRVYSPNRIKYPLKRIDWDPNGERNTQNRGKSKYKRISWEEATELVTSEIKRVKKQYGDLGILCQADGHGEGKTIHGGHGCQTQLLGKMGEYTLQLRNPDSWEGWYWGAKHIWGSMCIGMQAQQSNIIKDVLENSGMVLYWGGDPNTTGAHAPGYYGQWFINVCKELGIKNIFICPDLTYTANINADKWIPILPNTDAALQLAIAYIWITEGTYDQEYVATHVVGFDKFTDYVLGKEDGIPKTPKWASAKCSVPPWTIKALAREMARKKTSLSTVGAGGGSIRGPYCHEPARLMVCLLGMQGLGKPGVNQIASPWSHWPRPVVDFREGWGGSSMWTGMQLTTMARQFIPKTLIHEAILNPPIHMMGSGGISLPTEDQFKKYTYPIPKEEGGTEIHMIWSDTPCRLTCWNHGFKNMEAFRSPKIECIVVQHPWLENDTLFADIILPVSTKAEQRDISMCVHEPIKAILYEDRLIDNIGESISDYEAVCEVARKFGDNIYKEFTTRKTVEERIESGFNSLGIQDHIDFKELKDKGYWIIPAAPDWEKDPVGLIGFYRDPEKNPLETPSGKLEFYSQRLAEHFPDDNERPPVPHWIEKSENHDERLSSERTKKYPLLLVSNHPHWRLHAQYDDVTWFRETPTGKITGYDGYQYEPVWINPKDALARGIKPGDIVKIYNERGIVLGGAYVSERIMSGVVSQDHGARVDLIATGPDEFIDRGGANNLISPFNISSKNAVGQATSGFLVEVARVDSAEMNEWRRKYPEAFRREYDPASGLVFNAWVEGGMD
jgi:molybdopterin guanine dinucleotide-containing S/N-oxide reductase-like protein